MPLRGFNEGGSSARIQAAHASQMAFEMAFGDEIRQHCLGKAIGTARGQ
jgi:hypothetical protein